VPEAVEDFVPGVSNDTMGDGNGDGILDRDQQDVASIPFRKTAVPSQEPNALPVFVTLTGGTRVRIWSSPVLQTMPDENRLLSYIRSQMKPNDRFGPR
jgi:hypothetical protein